MRLHKQHKIKALPLEHVLILGPEMEFLLHQDLYGGVSKTCASGSVQSPYMDLHAWSYWLAKRVLVDECGMAAFGNRAPWISSHTLGRHPAFWKCFLRRRDRKFRDRGSNRQFCFANLRRRIAAADYRPAGPDGMRRLPEAHAKSHPHDAWNELWDPFLKNFGGWARPLLSSKPLLPLSWRMGCSLRLFLFGGPTANGFSPGATNAFSSCASSGMRSSRGRCHTTDGVRNHLTGESLEPWCLTHSKLRGQRSPRGC